MCSQQTCRKRYAGFRKHLDCSHQVDQTCVSSLAVELNVPSDDSSRLDFSESSSVVRDSHSVNFENSGEGLNTKNLKDMCAAIVSKIQRSGASSNTVTSIVSDLEEFATEMHSQIKQTVLQSFWIVFL